MKKICWTRYLRSHALALALLMTLPCISIAGSVAIFTPEGKIADVQQVRATFDEAMLPLGSISAADPFTIACPMRGRAHWIDQKTWVWDMPAADPEGQKCTFTLRNDLKTLSGNPITGRRVFNFELPELSYNQRIRIQYTQPYPGVVREDQLFLVTFDHPIQSPRPALYCISDDQPRQAVLVDDDDQEPIRHSKLGDKERSIAVRCPGPLAQSSRLRLLLDRGPGRDTSTFEYHVRGPAGAGIDCVEIEPGATAQSCVPGRAVALKFNSVIPEKSLRDIRLQTPSGAVAGTPHTDAGEQFRLGSSFINFDVKLDPDQSYKLEYPAKMLDIDGRPVMQSQLPSAVRTSHALAVVGFEARNIAVVRRSLNSSLQMLMDQHPMPAHLAELVVGNETDPQAADQSILQWLDRFQLAEVPAEFHSDPKRFRTTEVRSDRTGALSLPLQEPGLHVFVTAQSIAMDSTKANSLEQELDAGAVPEYAGAIATSMAVFLKTSQENGAVWVMNLDDGKPVARAHVAVYGNDHILVWEGDTDASGLASIPVPMLLPSGYTAIVRATDRHGRKDISVTRSGWDDAIPSGTGYWFYGRHRGELHGLRADSILDRSLVKPGEKISMRTVIRSETSSGLAYLKSAQRPSSMRIAHTASGQHWDFPLSWDHADDALTTFEVPASAPLGAYNISLLWGDHPDSPYDQFSSGSFSVEAYRVPSFSADVSIAAEPVLVGSTPTVALNLHFQDGSPASGLAVKLSATLNQEIARGVFLPGFFENPSPPIRDGHFWPQDGKSVALAKKQVTLDKDGKASFTLPALPKVDDDYSLHLEATFLDSSGEVQTITRSFNVRRSPLRLQVAVSGRAQVGSLVEVRMRSIADDDSVRAHETVSVRAEFSQDGRIGTRSSLGPVCSSVTDATGSASCFYRITRAGNYTFIVSGNDELGHAVASECDIWASDALDRMKDLFLSADKLEYQPGEVAHIKVTTPFDTARAWLAVEREGVIDSKVITLNGPMTEIEVPIEASYGPNVFVSLLAIPPAERLEEGDLPPHATGTMSLGVTRDNNTLKVSVAADQPSYAPHQTAKLRIHVSQADGKPASGPLRASLALVDEALLDLKDNSSWNLLDQMMQQRVNGVATSTPLAQVIPRDKAARLKQLQDELINQLRPGAVAASLTRFRAGSMPQMAALSAPAPAPVAAGAQSLDRVTVTGSNLRRADTETPSPVQFFESKAIVAGDKASNGGNKGGAVEMRRIASSLLFWQPDVVLDDKGDATVSVPINDALSRFRVVAVASAGNQRFGNGSTEIVVTKDVQIVSGLAPLVREGDSLKQIVTLRSRASRPLQLDVAADAKGIGSVLAPNHVVLQPGEAKDISFDFTVPKSIKTLQFEISAIETSHPENGDRLAVEQGVLPSVPVEVVASTFDQLKPTLEIPVAAPPGSLPQSAHVEIALQARLAQPMPGVTQWMLRYPFDCIEQRTSIALATHNKAGLQAVFTDLPKYLDDDGLVNYFPTGGYSRQGGSDVLTSYLLDIAKAYGVALPDAEQNRMLQALARFARGQLQRHSWAPRDDTTARRLAAMAALSLYSQSDAAMLQGIKVDVDDWSTAMLLDWVTALRHTPGVPAQQVSEKSVDQQLHARLTYQGRRAVLSNEKRDFWFWMMQSGDADTARLITVMIDQPGWREEMPRLAQGMLARQTKGAWLTTVANAWGVVAMEKFSASFESQPVTGITKVELNQQAASMQLNESDRTPPLPIEFPLDARTSSLKLTQVGSGAPWATVSVFAAVPITAPRYAGYTIDKSIVPVSQKVKGVVSVGDIYRVKLSIEAQSDSTWVVIRDPVAAGVSILGNGLSRDSAEATQGEERSGAAWPEYTERDFTVYRSYYRFVPRGKFSTEYTFRVNNPGTFLLPPTRVEAMYAPDVFGELPNASLKVVP